MFTPGDVVLLWSEGAKKPKFHLCIALNNAFFYLNTPNAKPYPGDFAVPCSDIPFLTPTPTGESIICCSLVLRPSAKALKKMKPEKKGELSSKVLTKLITFIEHSAVLTQAEKDEILDALVDRLRE